MHTKRECPVCGTEDAVLLHTIRYPDEKKRILPLEYRIVRCAVCGMVFDDFDAKKDDFVKYYDSLEKYFMPNISGSGGSSAADAVKFREIADFLEPHLNGYDLPIADIGCGKGGMLHEFLRRGHKNLWAVDNSRKCIDFIRKNTSFRTVHSALDDLNIDMKFSLIVCSQIFEHLYSPRHSLEVLKNILDDRGLLYIDVPDAKRYCDYMYKPYHYFDAEHINHFSVEYMSGLLSSAGLDVVASGTHEIELTDGVIYPNCRFLATKSGRSSGPPAISGAEYAKCLDAYIRKSAEAADRAAKAIADIRFDLDFYIWGLGAYGLKLLNSGMFDSWRVVGLIDSDNSKHGTTVRGKTVYPPEILRGRSDCGVCITSAVYEEQIREQLVGLGFSGRIVTV